MMADTTKQDALDNLDEIDIEVDQAAHAIPLFWEKHYRNPKDLLATVRSFVEAQS
jgi:hypothetical protein